MQVRRLEADIGEPCSKVKVLHNAVSGDMI
jgi:hypothetical protein